MTFTNSILTIGELIVLFFQLGNYYSRRHDKTRLRFLILTIVFIAYNLLIGFLSAKNGLDPQYYHVIIAITGGTLLGSYYFYYLVTELEINYKRHFHLRYFMISLLGSFIICASFVYWLTNDLSYLLASSIILPLVTACYFCVIIIVFHIKEKNSRLFDTEYRVLVLTSNIGVLIIIALPISILFEELSFYSLVIVNFTYLIALFSYIRYYHFQCKIENDFLNKSGYLPNTIIENKLDQLFTDDFVTLTNREKQIAYYMLLNMTHLEISKKLYLARNTVTNYASKIYNKTNTTDLEGFKDKFQSTVQKN